MEIHLQDCSHIWEDMITDASDSIVVFTPYFDEILVELLGECSLPYSQITLVTQLDWADPRTENISRLNLILDLHNKGVNVKILNRLHAKILSVDRDRALFGSQNFTRYSTNSFEITTEISYLDDESEDFFDVLDEWIDLARPISFDEMTVASGNRMTYTAVQNLDDDDDDDVDSDDDD